MARAKPTAKKKGLSVDFSDTETQVALEEGDYLLEVDESEVKESKEGNDYISLKFKVAEGDFEGKTVYHNCSLQPQALFNLRGVLEALGFEVPQGVMELDPADLIGEQCGATVGMETYEGKPRPRITEFFSADELQTEEEAPVKPAKKGKAEEPTKPVKKGKAVEPAEEPEEEPAPKASAKKKVVKKVEPEIEVGSTVSFTDDEGDEQEGEVTEIDDTTVTVKVGTGKKAEEWELDLEDLTLVETE